MNGFRSKDNPEASLFGKKLCCSREGKLHDLAQSVEIWTYLNLDVSLASCSPEPSFSPSQRTLRFLRSIQMLLLRSSIRRRKFAGSQTCMLGSARVTSALLADSVAWLAQLGARS